MEIKLINCEGYELLCLQSVLEWIQKKEYPQHENIGRRHSGVSRLTLSNRKIVSFEIWKTKKGWVGRLICVNDGS